MPSDSGLISYLLNLLILITHLVHPFFKLGILDSGYIFKVCFEMFSVYTQKVHRGKKLFSTILNRGAHAREPEIAMGLCHMVEYAHLSLIKGFS